MRAILCGVTLRNAPGSIRVPGGDQLARLRARWATVSTALLLSLGVQLARCEPPVTPTLQLVPIDVPGLWNARTNGETNTRGLTGVGGKVDRVVYAVSSGTWPAGLVAVFGFERRGVYQLSRRPKPGWENLLDPIFFALPRTAETNAHALTGGWAVTAIHDGGHSDEFRWELTTDGEQVSGRLDPNTDYRFATLSGGTWTGNHLQLKVDYINDHFEMSGQLADGVLSGHWHRTDDGDGGEWIARRSALIPKVITDQRSTAPLYEWAFRSTGEKQYSLDSVGVDPGWRRTDDPICRVWVTPAAPAGDHPQEP